MKTSAIRFLLVGGLGYLVDVGLFNLLMLLSFFQENELYAFLIKIFSSLLALFITFWANKNWTFRDRGSSQKAIAGLFKFTVVNFIGIAIMLLCMWFNRSILNNVSLLGDNISANVIGAGAALLFRFFANRYWVFPTTRKKS